MYIQMQTDLMSSIKAVGSVRRTFSPLPPPPPTLSSSPDANRVVDILIQSSSVSYSSNFLTLASASRWVSVASKTSHKSGQSTAVAITFPSLPQCVIHSSSNKYIKPVGIFGRFPYSCNSPHTSSIQATLPQMKVDGQPWISPMDVSFFSILAGSPSISG